MKKRRVHRVFLSEFMKLVVAGAVLTLSCMGMGCGGGGDDAPPPSAPTTATLSGIASKAPINGGNVSVYEIDEKGKKGRTALGKTKTDENGAYSIEVDYIGPVLVEVTGGKYTDEATGETVDLTMTLRAAKGEAVGEVKVAVTPLTELAVRKAEPGRFTPEKIGESNELISQLVGFDISTTLPADPYDLGASGIDSQKYALFLAALSQMAANKDTDIAKIIDAIEEDLDDLLLNDTGADLRLALDDYVLNTGVTNDHGLGEHISEIIDGGLTPPGDLGMAEDLLADFLAEPTLENYEAFTEYVYSNAPNSEEGSLFLALADLVFAPNSEEEGLFMALADLIDIYNEGGSDFSMLVLNIENILEIDYGPYFEKMLLEDKSDKYLRLSIYETDERDLLAEMEARLDRVDALLDEAQEINAVIFLPGFDTFYFDDIDVMVLKTTVYELKAICAYAQSLNLMADSWREDMTDEERDEFIINNEDLLTYIDLGKLDAFTTAFQSAKDQFNASVTALNDIGESGRTSRRENAFNTDTPYRISVLRAVRDETLPSIQRAFDYWYEFIITVDEQALDRKVIVAEDGYAYFQTDYALYLKHLAPVNEHVATLYHLVSGIKSPRNIWEDFYQARQRNEDYKPYWEAEHERAPYPPYPVPLPHTEWDHPIDTYTVQEATIKIDGDEYDWGAVPKLKYDVNIKLARDNNDREDNYYFYVKPEGSPYEYNLFMEMPFTGDSYRAEVKWDGEELLVANEYRRKPGEDVDEDPVADVHFIERFGSVIGFEVKFSHFSTLVKAGSINKFCYGSTCNKDTDDWPEIKLLPEADE